MSVAKAPYPIEGAGESKEIIGRGIPSAYPGYASETEIVTYHAVNYLFQNDSGRNSEPALTDKLIPGTSQPYNQLTGSEQQIVLAAFEHLSQADGHPLQKNAQLILNPPEVLPEQTKPAAAVQAASHTGTQQSGPAPEADQSREPVFADEQSNVIEFKPLTIQHKDAVLDLRSLADFQTVINALRRHLDTTGDHTNSEQIYHRLERRLTARDTELALAGAATIMTHAVSLETLRGEEAIAARRLLLPLATLDLTNKSVEAGVPYLAASARELLASQGAVTLEVAEPSTQELLVDSAA